MKQHGALPALKAEAFVDMHKQNVPRDYRRIMESKQALETADCKS